MSLHPDLAQGTAYFTVVGSQDPQLTPGGAQGPALDLLDALLASGEVVTEVVMAWTPGAANRSWPAGYDEQLFALQTAVRDRLPGVLLSTVPITVKPNAAAELVPVLAQALTRYRHGGRLLANASSGTPQMLEALKLLRGTGWFAEGDVHLLQVDRPEYRRPGQPFWRAATTPFLEETLRLNAAFGAMRRFDFAGAREAFGHLTAGPLELPDRAAAVRALEVVADALWWLDARNAEAASETLAGLALHLPSVSGLFQFTQAATHSEADALIWLTWGRYDRAAAQERVADALVWAGVLQELLVVKLAEKAGLPDTEQALRPQDLRTGLFGTLKSQAADDCVNSKGNLNFRTLREKLALLRAPVLGISNVDVFDSAVNADLATLRKWRNLVLHQGRVPEQVDLNTVDKVVERLLRAYPFESDWGRDWAALPSTAVVSSTSLLRLSDELQIWMG